MSGTRLEPTWIGKQDWPRPEPRILVEQPECGVPAKDGSPADEAHFVGRHEKMPILRAMRTHILLGDQERHFLGASGVVSSGLVPGPHRPELPIVPA